MLQTSVDLGYLEVNQLISDEGRLLENRYTLAKSFRGDGSLNEFCQRKEPLLVCSKVTECYLQLAASVLADSGNFEVLEKVVIQADAPENLIWLYYQALITLRKTGGVELSDGLSNTSHESVVVLWGQLLLKAGNLAELIELLYNQAYQGVDIWNLRARTFVLTQK